ncbi:MAG: CotS family spore coat protein [Eubacteriales bacterium]
MNTAVNEPLEQVLAEYDVNVSKITLETYKGKKGVWWVDTDRGKKILKKMPMGRERLLFVLSAIDHLDAKGVNLPKVIKTKNGALFVEIEGANFVLSEAVTAKSPSYNTPSELAMIMRGMAGFHAASPGFQPPAEAQTCSHLGIWPKIYMERIEDLKKFKEQAAQNKSTQFETLYLAECDRFISLAKSSLAELLNSPYANLVKAAGQTVNLCHQDFASGNLGLVSKDCIYIFDTDGIAYDLAACDIRKICNKVMKKRGGWDLKLFKEMLRTYHSVNPLTLEEYVVLFIDLRFPHLFYGIASKYYQSCEKEWPEHKFQQRLLTMIKTENSKITVLDAALPLDWLNPKVQPEG